MIQKTFGIESLFYKIYIILLLGTFCLDAPAVWVIPYGLLLLGILFNLYGRFTSKAVLTGSNMMFGLAFLCLVLNKLLTNPDNSFGINETVYTEIYLAAVGIILVYIGYSLKKMKRIA